MDNNDNFIHFEPLNPIDNWNILGDIGRPMELYQLLAAQEYGLALISGYDESEIRRTLIALARTFQKNEQEIISLRVGESDPFPGVAEIHSNQPVSAGRSLMRWGSYNVIMMDSVDTKEKVLFAVEAALVGKIVVAPVQANTAWEAVEKVLALNPTMSPWLLSDSLVYVAHHETIPDPGAETLVNVSITLKDHDFGERILNYRR